MNVKRVVSIIVSVIAIVVLAIAQGPRLAGLVLASSQGDAQPAQFTATLYAEADTTIRSWQPDSNFGSEGTLEISFSSDPEPRAEFILLRFDLSQLPDNAVIESAVLQLWLETGSGADLVMTTAYAVTSPWQEEWVTWASMPSVATMGTIGYVDTTTGYQTWNATGFAQNWQSGTNYGVELRGPLEGASWTRTFQSREWGGDRPRLVVDYHVDSPLLSGTVFDGEMDDQSQPLAGVTVSLYGATGPYPTEGVFLASTTTDAQGHYSLGAPEGHEFYHLRETDPAGYVSVGATSTGGTVRTSNWIEYSYPLEGKFLTGNSFWDQPQPPEDSIPPGNWQSFAPSGWVNNQTVNAQVQVEDSGSGLNVSTAAYSYSTDGGGSWSSWYAATCSGSDGTTAPQILTATDVPFGQDTTSPGLNLIKFRVADMVHNTGESATYSLQIDASPPQNPTNLFCTHFPGVWSSNNVVTCQWVGALDQVSGLAGYSYTWDHAPGTVPDSVVDTDQESTTSFPLADDDDWWIHVRAVDSAGNGAEGAVHHGPFHIDTQPPSSMAHSPDTANASSFPVEWTGSDAGSGIDSFDIEYRDVTEGTPWELWQSQTTSTADTFPGQLEHTYQFRSRARDLLGHVEDWPATPDTTTYVPALDFAATGLEITQAVQDLDNSVVLVEGKRTYARFHVRSLIDGDQGPVTARLQAFRGMDNLGTISPNNPGGTITVRDYPDRENLGHTFYFDLPFSWLHGSVTFVAQIDPDGAWHESDTSNNARAAPVTFEQTPEMNLVLYDACYTSGGTTYHVRDTDREKLASWLRRAYPIHRLNVQWRTLTPCFDQPPEAAEVNARLKLEWIFNVSWGSDDEYTRYYGMVDDGFWRTTDGCWMRGEGAIGGIFSSGPAGEPDRCATWDTDGSYADWYGGHELGHNYNQGHTLGTQPPPPTCPSCGCEGGGITYYPNGDISPTRNPIAANALFGFDVETLAIYAPSWKDLMTYCDNQWVSDYTYEGIRDRMVQESESSTRGTHLLQAGERLAVLGRIDTATGQVELDELYRVPDALDLLERVPGEYSIRLLGAGDSLLADYPFTPKSSHVDPGPSCQDSETAESPALITELVPWVEGAVRIAIYHGTQELISRPVSAHAPAVALSHPNSGALAGEEIEVAWEASDADGNPLEFTVQFSVDGGAHWTVLGSGIRTTSLVLDADAVPGTDQGKFRILATDGVNTSQDQSDGLLTVPNKAPQVRIESPHPGAVYAPGQSVALVANALDVEDGSLDDSAFSWHSSLDGALGTGSLLHVNDLSEGSHLITITAIDSDGEQVSSQVTIYLGGLPERIYLPIVLRLSP